MNFQIIESEMAVRGGRIKVQVEESPEPVPSRHSAAPYKTAQHAAAACG